jgi:hypothetical protein
MSLSHRRIGIPVLVVLLALAGVAFVRFATTGHAATSGSRTAAGRFGGGEGGCEDVTGSIVPGQRGMTAVTSTQAPSVPIGSKVRITASDRDRPANSKSVIVTVTGAQQLPANVCLDLSPDAFRIFDPQGAAYRDANVEIVAGG